MTVKIKDLIGWDGKTFVLGSHDRKGNDLKASTDELVAYDREVKTLLADMSQWSRDDHDALAAAVREPIMQVVPYVEQYNAFFMDDQYADNEDNAIPVEDTVAVAFATHRDGGARYVRSGYSWTRPSFQTWDTAMDVGWAQARRTGWNFFSRQMQRAVEELARKRDVAAKAVWEAALPAAQVVAISGGALTKAAVDSVIKGSADIGFPVQRALINPGTFADMASFVWPSGNFVPAQQMEELIRTLHISDYGGVQWYTNPFFPTNEVKFSGDPSQVGWHQVRGSVRNSSDIDMDNKRDKYLIEDADHAWYIGNVSTLWQITIAA